MTIDLGGISNLKNISYGRNYSKNKEWHYGGNFGTRQNGR